MRVDTSAPETRGSKGTEQAEGRVPQISRETSCAEKVLSKENERKTRKEVEEKQAWQEAQETEHSL